jgi:hypothetical protein
MPPPLLLLPLLMVAPPPLPLRHGCCTDSGRRHKGRAGANVKHHYPTQQPVDLVLLL